MTRRIDAKPTVTTRSGQLANSCPAADLATDRDALSCATAAQWRSAALRAACGQLHESWLDVKAREIGIVAGSGFAVLATGSLGRRELLPHSDLDLLLVHDNMSDHAVEKIAEGLWYPLWDARVRLDHSVRTIPQALKVAGSDMLAGLAMLEARHIAGDERLSHRLISAARKQWQHGIAARYDDLVELSHSRWQRNGDIAGSPAPDLKNGRGGLRDVQLLHALVLSHRVDRKSTGVANPLKGLLREAHRLVLDVRTELHRACGRSNDLLTAEYADDIIGALGLVGRGDLAAHLSDAAQIISTRVDAELQAVASAVRHRGASSAISA